jgi:hypothetical protein
VAVVLPGTGAALGPNANKSGFLKALKLMVEDCLQFELTMP